MASNMLLQRFALGLSAAVLSGGHVTRSQATAEKDVEARQPQGTLIVKYGGSAITLKSTFETLKPDALADSASHIADAYRSGCWSRVIVVHGAGSYGHFHAKQYDLKNGRLPGSDQQSSETSWQAGLARTRLSVLTLNQEVLRAHVELGLPAVTVSAFPSAITGQSKKSPSYPINPSGSTIVAPGVLHQIQTLTRQGLLPLLHGDVVLDESQTCAILGGDHIISWLCRNINSSDTIEKSRPPSPQERIRVVFLTDVAGVYDRAPHIPGATLIRRVLVHPDGTTDFCGGTEVAEHDVTGGIEAKVKVGVQMALLGEHVEVLVVQAGSASAAQALRGLPPQEGTLISMRRS